MCMSLNYNKTHNECAVNKSDDNIEFDHFAIVALYFVVVVVSFLFYLFSFNKMGRLFSLNESAVDLCTACIHNTHHTHFTFYR